jgi:bla regulator protein blaR1
MTSGSIVVIFRLCAGCLAPLALAQSAAKALEFEIASVKPANPDARTSNVLLNAGESLTVVNVPLRKIITYAYDIRDFQLTGGPGWIGAEQYDIVAKTAVGDRPASEASTETDDGRKARVARVRERLRSLLSDRFGLRVHFEQRERTILHLRIGKGGPKLSEADANPQGRVSTVDGRIQGYGAPISMLATQLSMVTGLIVEDETGLRGKYDFVLDWAPDDAYPSDTRPSIFTAVSQLGLRLERANGPVNTLVIDHVERPSVN